MAITYTWKVTGLRKVQSAEGLNNVVIGTRWEKIGTDENGNEGKFVGATPFNVSAIDPDNFIDWENLTEEVVLSWIKPVVVGSYEDHVNNQIAKQIRDKKSPVEEVQQLPWDPNPPAVPNPKVDAA